MTEKRTPWKNQLTETLRNWDGKATAPLITAFSKFADEPSFVKELINGLHHQELQLAASWLLKHAMENGHELREQLHDHFHYSLSKATAWETKLHLLQVLPYLEFSRKYESELEAFIRESMTDKNKFVRAWAFGAFHQFASAFEEYREECRVVLSEAKESEAASIKARLRKLPDL